MNATQDPAIAPEILWQAIGLATTAGPPDMVMDASDPLGMMHQVVEETRRLRAYRDFHDHIQTHLPDGEEVICKVCGEPARTFIEDAEVV